MWGVLHDLWVYLRFVILQKGFFPGYQGTRDRCLIIFFAYVLRVRNVASFLLVDSLVGFPRRIAIELYHYILIFFFLPLF
jgi:hypothetical protein